MIFNFWQTRLLGDNCYCKQLIKLISTSSYIHFWNMPISSSLWSAFAQFVIFPGIIWIAAWDWHFSLFLRLLWQCWQYLTLHFQHSVFFCLYVHTLLAQSYINLSSLKEDFCVIFHIQLWESILFFFPHKYNIMLTMSFTLNWLI